MKHRATSLVLTSALGLGGLAAGVVLAPAVAVAATSDTSTADAVGDRVTRIKDALAGLVSDGSLTQAQADEVAAVLAEELPRGGPGHHRHGGPGRHLAAAAEIIGVAPGTLRAALQSGQSLAQVAESNGVSREELVAGLVAKAGDHLTEHVENGDITQEQADERLARITDRLEELVDREGLPRRGERPGPPAEDESMTTEPSALTS
ncbi:MAG TPA: hypothetical protein VNU26_07280 [Mycobacteriales bacterium]|nr:hypothetical protein [Mycobacteriales bacterium]